VLEKENIFKILGLFPVFFVMQIYCTDFVSSSLKIFIVNISQECHSDVTFLLKISIQRKYFRSPQLRDLFIEDIYSKEIFPIAKVK